MIRKSAGFVSRLGAASALVATCLCTSVLAHQPPSTGLGQSWPNAADVSASPHYHVYVFVRDGIRYIQVNDLNGTVRTAMAVADHVVLVLPVGVDASNVTTTHAPFSGDAETVYRDGALRITAAPTQTGATQFGVFTPANTTSDTGICTDPFNCTGQVVKGIPGG